MPVLKDKARRANMRCRVAAALAAIILPYGISNAETALSDWVIKNLADDHAECAAYFTVIANLPGMTESLTKQYTSSAKIALDRSVNLESKQRAVAAYKISVESMLRKIEEEKGDDGSMLLMEEHAFRCKDIMEDPQSHIERLKRQDG